MLHRVREVAPGYSCIICCVAVSLCWQGTHVKPTLPIGFCPGTARNCMCKTLGPLVVPVRLFGNRSPPTRPIMVADRDHQIKPILYVIRGLHAGGGIIVALWLCRKRSTKT